MKRARPQGLGSSTKKEKAEEVEASSVVENFEGGNSVNAPAPAEGTEKLFYELPEDATALDQLRALFESATMYLDDQNKAKPIFNGVIHECLRLEAILENEKGPEEQEGDDKDIDSFVQVKKDSEKIFNSEFYFIFGESLRTLAEFEMNEEIEESSMDQVKGLLSASIDRFQLSKEKRDGIDKEFSNDLTSGILYSMASLCVLIEENDQLKEDLKGLIEKESSSNESLKDVVSSAMFDAIEFYCGFIEISFENEFEIEGIEDLALILEKNIKIIPEFSIDSKKLKLVQVDIPLRLSIAKSEEITEEKASGFLADLDEFLKLEGEADMSLKYEALQLKASIKEILGEEEEAAKIYEEADSIVL